MTWWRQNAEQWRTAVRAAAMNWQTQPSYHDELLTLCNTLLAERKYELVVVVAQMACELVTEQTLAPLMPPGERVYNLQKNKLREQYKKLTGDTEIDKQDFWSSYHDHANRRHEIVHHGRRVIEAEAQESFTAARQFVMHLEVVRKRLGR